jgi:hypothetical protein
MDKEGRQLTEAQRAPSSHSGREREEKVDPPAESIPRDFFFIPVPKRLRHNPESPAHFGLFLNVVFAVATTFSAFVPSQTPNISNTNTPQSSVIYTGVSLF